MAHHPCREGGCPFSWILGVGVPMGQPPGKQGCFSPSDKETRVLGVTVQLGLRELFVAVFLSLNLGFLPGLWMSCMCKCCLFGPV